MKVFLERRTDDAIRVNRETILFKEVVKVIVVFVLTTLVAENENGLAGVKESFERLAFFLGKALLWRGEYKEVASM